MRGYRAHGCGLVRDQCVGPHYVKELWACIFPFCFHENCLVFLCLLMCYHSGASATLVMLAADPADSVQCFGDTIVPLGLCEPQTARLQVSGNVVTVKQWPGGQDAVQQGLLHRVATEDGEEGEP